MYELVKKVSGSNEIKGTITNDVYVDMGFCGKIDDIQNRLGLKYVRRKNEHLAFIQIRYPSTFKDSIVISNMQAALTLQASYLISFYPIHYINDLFYFINKSIFKVIQTPVFDNKCVGVSQVISYWPKELDSNFIKKMKNPNILNQIDISLNGDKELFKEVRSCCNKLELNIQWININDFDTYKNLIGNAINFCQRNIKTTNQIDYINIIFDYIQNSNSEIGFQNTVQKSHDFFLSFQPKPIFNINFTDNLQENILFNSKNFREFISFYNTELSSLYIIYFSFSNFADVKYITQIFPQAHIFNSYVTQKNGYDININFCGNVVGLIDDYDLKTKVKKKNVKSNLAFIYINNFQIDNNNNKTDDFLLLESIIASKCDAIITIANKQPSDIQIKYTNKLKNSLNIFNLINKTNKQDSFQSKYFYVINDSSMNKDDQDIEGFPDNVTKISLDIKDIQSCNSFLSMLLNELPDLGKQKKIFNYAKIDADLINNFAFHINLFQDFNITISGNNDTKNNTNNNLENNMTYNNPMAELAARLKKRRMLNELNANNNNDADDLCSYTVLNHDIAKNDNNKNNDIVINIHLLDETINRLAKFLINLNLNSVSVSNIDSFFIPILIKLREYNAFISYLMKIKNGVTIKYIDYITSDFIGQFLENDISNGVYMKELKEYIQNGIFYITKEFIEELKDQLENNIKDDIFKQAHQYCIKTKKSLDLRYLITNRVFELIKQRNSIEKCREEIDQIFNDRHKRNENIQLNKNQIAQDSLKYVLTVRESLKEMTVEIACNEDLEKEIPQGF